MAEEKSFDIKGLGEAKITREPSPEIIEKRDDGVDRIVPAKPGKLMVPQATVDDFMSKKTGIQDYPAVRKKINDAERELVKTATENGLFPKVMETGTDWELQAGIGPGNRYDLYYDAEKHTRDPNSGEERVKYGVVTFTKTMPNPMKDDPVYDKMSKEVEDFFVKRAKELSKKK